VRRQRAARRRGWYRLRMLLLALVACHPDDEVVDTDVPTVRYGFPLPEREKVDQRIGVDHDPTVQSDDVFGRVICTDYLGRGYPNCYDEHHGSDFILSGGFEAMDAGSMPIVAAADGVVVETDDGHYDHCHVDIETQDISCDGGDVHDANYVILQHADGMLSLYWHMMKDSVAVQVGDVVTCGQPLGTVGSSGYSSVPHLHFELNEPDGTVIDPYAGPFSQDESFWEQQDGDAWPAAGCAAP
jgi:murein DD-endopeptidase MepM/ murein hydrolase activator NlpD